MQDPALEVSAAAARIPGVRRGYETKTPDDPLARLVCDATTGVACRAPGVAYFYAADYTTSDLVAGNRDEVLSVRHVSYGIRLIQSDGISGDAA